MTLEDRCRKFLIETMASKQGHIVIDIIPDLAAFVTAEIGRAAGGEALDESLPLCLYFQTKEDREEFIAAVMEAKPNFVAKRLS